MPYHKVQRVQDAVHGLMEFRGLESAAVEVLRTEELQRLRRIRQLGLVHYVFPAAEHSRLAHSIGAAYLATRFAARISEVAADALAESPLRLGREAKRDFAVAALCHDLGHGPLSHVWEKEVIGENFDRSAWCLSLGLDEEPEFSKLKWHELVGQALLHWPDGELHRLLEIQEDGTSERIRSLLLKKHYVPYLGRLLAGDIDVDRCDFLTRDARQTGVAYGRFDLDWLISTVTLGTTSKELVVGFDRYKAPRVVEQMLVARRALYDTVYNHKTVRSAEGMMGSFLRRLRHVCQAEGGAGELEAIATAGDFLAPFKKVLGGDCLTPEEVMGLDDYALWVLIRHVATASAGDRTLVDLAKRICARDLFKQIPVSDDRIKTFIFGEDGRETICDAVAKHVPGGDPHYYVLVDRVEFKTFEEDSESTAYFVDPPKAGQSELGDAIPVWDHPRLRHLHSEPYELVRIFVPREAVRDVTRIVAGGAA